MVVDAASFAQEKPKQGALTAIHIVDAKKLEGSPFLRLLYDPRAKSHGGAASNFQQFPVRKPEVADRSQKQIARTQQPLYLRHIAFPHAQLEILGKLLNF